MTVRHDEIKLDQWNIELGPYTEPHILKMLGTQSDLRNASHQEIATFIVAKLNMPWERLVRLTSLKFYRT